MHSRIVIARALRARGNLTHQLPNSQKLPCYPPGSCEIAPQGHFLALRAQGATSACGLLAMTNLWLSPFYRQPALVDSIAPGGDSPAPTTRKQLPCTTPDFRQNVFDISGAGGYNKDVETQTVATNITFLFPICELDHSQISESSGCDRRLTFFLSEANRRSGRDAR